MESMSSVYCHQNAIVGEYLINLPSKYPFIRNSILSFFPQHRPHHSSTPPRGLWPASTLWCGWRAPTWSWSPSTGQWWQEAQPWLRSRLVPCAASANWRATAERAVYRDGESECKIIDFGFGWKSSWYDDYNYFQTRTKKGSKFPWLLAEGWGSQVLLELRSGRSLVCILAACRVDCCVTLWSNKTSSSRSSQFSCRHLVASEQSFTSKQEQI